MMAPPILFLAALVGYPFFYGIVLSLQDRMVAHAGIFVGLQNFITDFARPDLLAGRAITPSSIPGSQPS